MYGVVFLLLLVTGFQSARAAMSKEFVNKLNLSRGAAAMLTAFAAVSAIVLLVGFKDYPGLHTVLDTGIFLLSGLLALLFWEVGRRSGESLPQLIAISFAITSISESLHAFVSIEWSGRFVFLTQGAEVLRPTTWPPGVYLLPVGLGLSLWLMQRRSQHLVVFTLSLIGLAAALFVAVHWLPRFTSPTWFGITRPTLVLASVAWAVV